MATQTKPTVRRITLEEVRKRRKDLIFVDARSETALSRNPLQVRGAIHVPVKGASAGVKRLPHDRTIVTYCT
jgi:rhodanese-related sulfurtransferase